MLLHTCCFTLHTLNSGNSEWTCTRGPEASGYLVPTVQVDQKSPFSPQSHFLLLLLAGRCSEVKIHATQPVFFVPLCSGSALDTDIEVVNGHQAALSYTWGNYANKEEDNANWPLFPATHTLNIFVGRMRAPLTDDLRDEQSLQRITISQQHTNCAEEPKPIKSFEKVFHKFEVDSRWHHLSARIHLFLLISVGSRVGAAVLSDSEHSFRLKPVRGRGRRRFSL